MDQMPLVFSDHELIKIKTQDKCERFTGGVESLRSMARPDQADRIAPSQDAQQATSSSKSIGPIDWARGATSSSRDHVKAPDVNDPDLASQLCRYTHNHRLHG
ncbi:MAG: hypothetical protein RLZZ137_74 [Cyanobacteriota bacterium]|jgi:hypothetical protein